MGFWVRYRGAGRGGGYRGVYGYFKVMGGGGARLTCFAFPMMVGQF